MQAKLDAMAPGFRWRREATLVRTSVDDLSSATHGEMILTEGTGVNPPLIVAVDRRDAAGADQSALLELQQVGDRIAVTVGAAFVIGTITKTSETPNEPLSWSFECGTAWYYARGLDQYGDLPTGPGLFCAERWEDVDYARLDGSNLTQGFKNDVRSPRDPYDFNGDRSYTRLANDAVVAADRQFRFSADPALNTDVQLVVQFDPADVTASVERWLIHNAWVWGGAVLELNGVPVVLDKANRRYSASVRLVDGVVAAVGQSRVPTLREDTLTRDEVADFCLSGQVPWSAVTGEPTIPPTLPAAVSTGSDVTEADTDLRTGCNNDDLYAIVFLGAWSSETNNPVIRTMVIRFSDLPTTYHWISLRGGAGGARFMVRRNGDKIQWRRAGAVATTSTAHCYKLN